MYEIAVRESDTELSRHDIQFIVLYSGLGLSARKAEKMHRHRLEYSGTLFIDLNRLDPAAFRRSDLPSLVLSLAMQDATLPLFLAALEHFSAKWIRCAVKKCGSPKKRDDSTQVETALGV